MLIIVVVVIVALGDSSSSSSISSPSLETSKGRTICRWSLENMYLVIVPDRDMEFDNMYYQWTCGIISYASDEIPPLHNKDHTCYDKNISPMTDMQ